MKTTVAIEPPPPAWLVDWIRKPSYAQLRHSMVIGARCGAHQTAEAENVRNEDELSPAAKND